MSTASLVRRYWRWLAPGLALAIAVAASSMRDSHEFASASTEVLVDWANAPYLLDVAQPLEPLAQRAGVFAQLAPSQAVVSRIGAKAGIDPSQITASGPYKPTAPVTEREPSAERRAGQLAAERDHYRLRFDSEGRQGIPIVSIIAQAPTVAGANRLANSAAASLVDYVDELERQREVPASRTVALREVAKASGSVVNPGTDIQVAGLRFTGVLLAWFMLVVAVVRVGSPLRRHPSAAQAHGQAPEPEPPAALHFDPRVPELRR